jgi:hypothetical protein
MMIDMPRVPDGSVGVCNRAGTVGGGLGASVNNHQQCRKQPSQNARSLLGGLGGGLGRGNNIFG